MGEDERDWIKIVAIDPGIGRTGWAALSYHPVTKQIVVLKTTTLKGDALFRSRKEIRHLYDKPFCTLDAYEEEFCEILQRFMPNHVVCEGAFHHRFPQVLVSLTLVIHTLRRACSIVLKHDLHVVAPMQTKKTVANNVMADKDLIKASVLKRTDLVFDPDCADPDAMSEHEYDAIGHGICFIKLVLPTIRT